MNPVRARMGRLARLGLLRRLEPVSRDFGFDRGRPIDRYYIEGFLHRHREDIAGVVLEVADPHYTATFGGERVVRVDVLHAVEGNPKATIVADLADGSGLASDAYDCVVLTQTLFLIYDVGAAVRTLHRILRPGGVVLVTVPGVSRSVATYEGDAWPDYWRFTSLSARRLFETVFPPEEVAVEVYGNVLTAAAFLYGLAAEDLRPAELEAHDPDYELLLAVRARKPPRS